MNSDARISVAFPNHPKSIKLKRRLGSDGLLSLITLWLHVAQNKSSGVLTNMNTEDIEIAAQWNGESDEFIKTLIDLRLLDYKNETYSIHNWKKNNPYAFHADERSEKAKKAAEARWGKKKIKPQNDEPCSEHEQALHEANGSNSPSPYPIPIPIPYPAPKPKLLIDRYTEITQIHEKLSTIGMNEKWLLRLEDRKVIQSWVKQDLSEELLNEAIKKANHSQQGKPYGVFYLDPIIKQLIFKRDNPGDIHGSDKPSGKSIQQLNEEGAKAFLEQYGYGEEPSNIIDIQGGHG